MKNINQELLEQVSIAAKDNPRKRMNFNFHANGEELLQRMLNALEPETYLRPHRHTSQVEIFLLLRGKITVLLFNDVGEITTVKHLDPLEGEYGVEIPAGVWHTILVEEEGSVIYEIKEGPYVPNIGVEFATWAPEVHNTESSIAYIKALRGEIAGLINNRK
ncbi:WbuC family cupin fold metalloprotein [Marinifilum caeruleilacunae]|uniref:Cupin fold metalloprotein, WbuC family n=1 Tax=Marinifilum caeruleilacunae TaxID=2499076 RepID=A0ABX1WTC9_9BACT|nr:cupin fold metalloprotein, WbuC family [Marinifilum caeruleilacunae]